MPFCGNLLYKEMFGRVSLFMGMLYIDTYAHISIHMCIVIATDKHTLESTVSIYVTIYMYIYKLHPKCSVNTVNSRSVPL